MAVEGLVHDKGETSKARKEFLPIPSRTSGCKTDSFRHSALTDFLASNNISAAQIHNNYQQRLRNAQFQASHDGKETEAMINDQEDFSDEPAEETKKRKRKAKLKRENQLQERRISRPGQFNDNDKSGSQEMMCQKAMSLPGQLANCEICNKRFTVTPYSKSGPDGGLLCTACSKKVTTEERKSKGNIGGRNKRGRRQKSSNILDGIVQQGAFSLLEMCIKRVADNINEIEEFGDLPADLLRRLSQILTKRRALTPRTLDLFLRGDMTSIEICDCGNLEEDDFRKIFTFMPLLEKVNLQCAGQMKDETLEYLMFRDLPIKYLQLDASNLISDNCWRQYFRTRGSKLQCVKLSNLDNSLDDESVRQMATHCTNLRFLKLEGCWKLGNDSLLAIATLQKLEHLSLEFVNETIATNLVEVVKRLGSNLRTLSLRGFKNADGQVLRMIHQCCNSLSKLRFTDNAICSDKDYKELFRNWDNPPLTFVDLSRTRDVDNRNPDGPQDAIGLASEGFMALIEHSGGKIQKMDVSSCRHISRDAFSSVFNGTRKLPCLRELDISFHTVVDDFILGKIFKSCPALIKVIAFACFNVRDVQVPAGVALIGWLNTQDSACWSAMDHEQRKYLS